MTIEADVTNDVEERMKPIAHSTQAKRTIRREETHCTLLSAPFAQLCVDPERLGWLIVTLAQLLKWQSVRPLKLVYMTSLNLEIGIPSVCVRHFVLSCTMSSIDLSKPSLNPFLLQQHCPPHLLRSQIK